jgi:hypothetical protein
MLVMPAFAAQPAVAQGNCRTFSQTAKTVCDKFLAYWDNNGGLAQQGFPISDVLSEVSETDGKIYTVQYFERAVFEMHPEFAGTPNEVLLQLLGVYFWQKRYPNGASSQIPNAEPGARTYTETGKKLGGTFQRYWDSHGGLRQQGFPISDEFIEVNDLDGKPYKVQYFERAVFEFHPEFAGTPNEVLLSQVGTFAERSRHAAPVPPTQPPVVPTPTNPPVLPTTPPPPPPATSTPNPCAELPPANPDVLSFPTSRCARVGTLFSWTARGFQANENVGVYITAPDQSVYGPQFQLETDADGYIIDGVSLQTGPGFPTGLWAITFEGVDSHVTKVEKFVVLP